MNLFIEFIVFGNIHHLREIRMNRRAPDIRTVLSNSMKWAQVPQPGSPKAACLAG